jgi:hypothetical protein
MTSSERTGFYPACEYDYLEPLQLFKEWVDVFYFCDIRLTNSHVSKINFASKKANEKGLPTPSLLCIDAVQAIRHLRPVDLFFQRRDSHGEGGSGLFLLGNQQLPFVVAMVKANGLIVTDCSYIGSWLTNLKSNRESSLEVAGRNIKLLESQPWALNGLTAFVVN